MQNFFFKKIDSPENPRIKFLKKLGQKKFRKTENVFLVENFTIIRDALKAGINCEELYTTSDFLKKNSDFFKTLNQTEIFIINERTNNHFSTLENPSGICAIYKKTKKKQDKGPVVYLNDIRDPGNVGTILRTASAFGFKNIILDKTCTELYNPKTIQSAKDAIFKLNIYEDGNIEQLRNSNLPIYTTSSHNGQNLKSFKPANSYILVLGNESNGVNKEIEELKTKSIKIEMNKDMESLNVAISASIIFYEFKNS